MKTLQQWLDEMDKLDLEAKGGLLFEIYERDITIRWLVDERTRGISVKGLFELPRAVRVIKLLIEEQCRATEYTEDLKALNAKIKKILNEEVG